MPLATASEQLGEVRAGAVMARVASIWLCNSPALSGVRVSTELSLLGSAARRSSARSTGGASVLAGGSRSSRLRSLRCETGQGGRHRRHPRRHGAGSARWSRRRRHRRTCRRARGRCGSARPRDRAAVCSARGRYPQARLPFSGIHRFPWGTAWPRSGSSGRRFAQWRCAAGHAVCRDTRASPLGTPPARPARVAAGQGDGRVARWAWVARSSCTPTKQPPCQRKTPTFCADAPAR
jgi:hypothetical protein